MRAPGRARRARTAGAALAVVAVGLAGCGSSTGPVALTPPTAAASPAGRCARLHAALPAALDGHPRRATDPASPLTAAYGDPPITLRCGGPLPPILTPGSPSYDPLAQQDVVNGVGWVFETIPHGHRFTTYQRTANVELTVPDHYDPNAVNPLVDLAAPIKATIPAAPAGQ